MSVKLYIEIIDFLKHQKNILNYFERDNAILMHNNPEVIRLFESLKYNLNFLEKNINKIIERSNE